MTSVVMIAGMTPLAMGAEQTAPLGIAVIGGLVASTLTALVIIGTLILTVALLPALDALRAGILSAEIAESVTAAYVRLRDKTEVVLAEPFAALELEEASAAGAPSAYSDGLATPARRLVYLYRHDGDDADGDTDPSTGTDPDILRVRVLIEGTHHSAETLVSR